MKISEMIKQLSALKESAGDIDVWNSESDELVSDIILDEEFYKASEYINPEDVKRIWIE